METEGRFLEKLVTNHPTDALTTIEKQPDDTIASLLSGLPIQLTSRLLVLMEGFRAVRVMNILDTDLTSQLLESFPVSTSASLLRLLDDEQQGRFLQGVSDEVSKNILRLLHFPEQTVGARLDSRIFTLSENLTAEASLDRVRLHEEHIDNQILVLDASHRLVGYLGLRELIAAEPQRKIGDITNTELPSIIADTRVSEGLIESQNWEYPLRRIPVVDSDGLFLGVVSKASLSGINLDEKDLKRRASQASSALAELYQIGLSGLFRSTD